MAVYEVAIGGQYRIGPTSGAGSALGAAVAVPASIMDRRMV